MTEASLPQKETKMCILCKEFVHVDGDSGLCKIYDFLVLIDLARRTRVCEGFEE